MSWTPPVRQQVDALLADLLATVPVSRSTQLDQDGLGWFAETLLEGGDPGFWVSPEDPEAWAAYLLVDRMHDWVVEELPAYHLPTNWPVCPEHPASHPMQVEEPLDADQPELWWTCPTSGHRVTPLGSLA